MIYMRKLGKKIVERRKELNMTRKDLCRKSGRSEYMVHSMEVGYAQSLRPGLCQIAEALGMDIERLLEGCIDKIDFENYKKRNPQFFT